MAARYQHKRRLTAGQEPVAADVLEGEIVLNTADGKGWTKNNSGALVRLFPSNRSWVAKTGNYTLTATDYGVRVDSTAGGVTLTLPDAAALPDAMFIVKDWKGTSAVNNITVATTASQTIDGQVSVVIKTAYVSLTFVSDGANWMII